MLEFAAIFVAGLVVVSVGADVFVRGASGLAVRLGITPFVVGLVIVAFGTSAPELAVNLSAALRGTPDLALGNIVGSNIANAGLILGACALARPLLVELRMLRVEVPIMIGSGVLLWLLALDGRVSRWDGMLLLGGFVAFLIALLRTSRTEASAVREQFVDVAKPAPGLGRCLLLMGLGLGGLLLGAEGCVGGAVGLARHFGLSDLLIGLTIVAIGTSLPELAASVAAALRGHSDIAIGNVVGSCIYNVLFVLGTTAILSPLPVAESLTSVEIPLMVAFTLVLHPIMRIGMSVSRAAGALLLAAYAAVLALQVAQPIF